MESLGYFCSPYHSTIHATHLHCPIDKDNNSGFCFSNLICTLLEKVFFTLLTKCHELGRSSHVHKKYKYAQSSAVHLLKKTRHHVDLRNPTNKRVFLTLINKPQVIHAFLTLCQRNYCICIGNLNFIKPHTNNVTFWMFGNIIFTLFDKM